MVKSGYHTSILHMGMLESSKISNKNVEEIKFISSNMTQQSFACVWEAESHCVLSEGQSAVKLKSL